jgi:hypothetical protein
MNRREKILASVTGSLLAVGTIWFLVFSDDARPTEILEADRNTKNEEIEKKKKILTDAKRDEKRYAEWRRRALPTDVVLARSLYQNWLRRLAEQSKIKQLDLKPKEFQAKREPGTKKDLYTQISFTLHGRASLADLTTFLHAFYKAGHLHQIRLLEIKPVEEGRELDVSMTIEALSLPNADRSSDLSEESGHGLLLAELKDYSETIEHRNFFAKVAPKEVEKKADPLQSVYVTGFTQVDGAWKVWLFDRTTSKKWILREGESFDIGDVHGVVKSIDETHRVSFEIGGQTRLLRNGENLTGVAVEGGGDKPDRRRHGPGAGGFGPGGPRPGGSRPGGPGGDGGPPRDGAPMPGGNAAMPPKDPEGAANAAAPGAGAASSGTAKSDQENAPKEEEEEKK